MTSDQPNEPAKQLSLWDEFVEQSQNIQRDDSTRAGIEKSALDDCTNTLMEQIVDDVLMEMAWARVAFAKRMDWSTWVTSFVALAVRFG
jgi:hypothetical protein